MSGSPKALIISLPAPFPSPNQISPVVYPGAEEGEVGTEMTREEVFLSFQPRLHLQALAWLKFLGQFGL